MMITGKDATILGILAQAPNYYRRKQLLEALSEIALPLGLYICGIGDGFIPEDIKKIGDRYINRFAKTRHFGDMR